MNIAEIEQFLDECSHLADKLRSGVRVERAALWRQEDMACHKCKTFTLYTAPYPVARQAKAGWLVHICTSCEQMWVD